MRELLACSIKNYQLIVKNSRFGCGGKSTIHRSVNSTQLSHTLTLPLILPSTSTYSTWHRSNRPHVPRSFPGKPIRVIPGISGTPLTWGSGKSGGRVGGCGHVTGCLDIIDSERRASRVVAFPKVVWKVNWGVPRHEGASGHPCGSVQTSIYNPAALTHRWCPIEQLEVDNLMPS